MWGPKRARIALGDSQLLPVQPKWRDWTDLWEGPAGLIAERLLDNDVADYVSFRAVCRSWRLCSTDPHKCSILDRRFHPRHCIMLRGSGGEPSSCQFMNVSTGYCRYLDLPELRGRGKFRTSEGLLTLLDRTTSMVSILNPFTCQAAELPPATTLLTQRELALSNPTINLWEVIGAGLADESTIAVYFGRIQIVAVIKPGDAHWKVVDRGTRICLAMSFAGRFYCATNRNIMVVETSADHPPRLAIAAELTSPLSMMMMDTVHLVDNEGMLILVDRRFVSNDSREFVNGNGSRTYNLYRIDLDARKIVPVHGLGGRSLFMGLQLALSVSPLVFPSISADAIYLGFDSLLTHRLDNSPIHLMNGTSEPREFKDSSYGPLGIDYHLSWFVTGYHNDG